MYNQIIRRTFRVNLPRDAIWLRIQKKSEFLSKAAINYQDYTPVIIRIIYEPSWWISIMVDSSDQLTDLGYLLEISAAAMPDIAFSKAEIESIMLKVDKTAQVLIDSMNSSYTNPEHLEN